jgi:hypothetical protein
MLTAILVPAATVQGERLPTSRSAMLVLVIGLVLGGAAKLLLGSRSSLSWPAAILSGILGGAIGGPIAYALFGGTLLGVTLTGILVTIATLLIAERWQRRDEPAAELVANGESAKVEFKSTARANLQKGGVRDERMEQVIAKTIVGFLNSTGGTLIIGVDDAGTPLGLEADLALMKFPDNDRYELFLRDLMTNIAGAAATASLRVEFATLDGESICVVRVPPSPRPVFLRLKGKPAAFVARVGNSTREFPVDEALSYVARHWRLGLARRLGRR